MTTTDQLDEARVEEFAGQLIGYYTHGLITNLIDIGHRTDLFAALAAGPATSAELAERADLTERYVREWLGAMTSSGIVGYSPETASYSLPAEHAACLAGNGAGNLAPVSQLNAHLAKHLNGVTRAFREGGGVSYDEFRPEFTDVMDSLGRGLYDELLVDAYLPLAPGVAERLANGARAADVACGTGHAINVLARAFPASTFVGYDIDHDSISRARAEAADWGLTNATFSITDVARLTVEQPFDAVFVFNAIHDQVEPTGVLAAIHRSLADDGVFVMDEPRGPASVEAGVGDPLAAFLYAISTLHCLTVSLAHGGTGLGTAWSEASARAMLAEAGFAGVEVHLAPGDPANAVYVSRKR